MIACHKCLDGCDDCYYQIGANGRPLCEPCYFAIKTEDKAIDKLEADEYFKMIERIWRETINI